jgi:hypothetical protein
METLEYSISSPPFNFLQGFQPLIPCDVAKHKPELYFVPILGTETVFSFLPNLKLQRRRLKTAGSLSTISLRLSNLREGRPLDPCYYGPASYYLRIQKSPYELF